MSAVIAIATRVFRMNSLELPDPDPSLPPDDVRMLYANSYPFLATASVSEGRLERDQLVYEFEKADAKSKG